MVNRINRSARQNGGNPRGKRRAARQMRSGICTMCTTVCPRLWPEGLISVARTARYHGLTADTLNKGGRMTKKLGIMLLLLMMVATFAAVGCGGDDNEASSDSTEATEEGTETTEDGSGTTEEATETSGSFDYAMSGLYK